MPFFVGHDYGCASSHSRLKEKSITRLNHWANFYPLGHSHHKKMKFCDQNNPLLRPIQKHQNSKLTQLWTKAQP